MSNAYAQDGHQAEKLVQLFYQTDSSLQQQDKFRKGGLFWDDSNGILLRTKEINNIESVYFIRLWVNPWTESGVQYRGMPYKEALPAGLNGEMNYKNALKILKKREDVEILIKDRKEVGIYFLWKVRNPYNELNPVRQNEAMAFDGVLVRLYFTSWKPEVIWKLDIEAHHKWLTELGRKLYLSN